MPIWPTKRLHTITRGRPQEGSQEAWWEGRGQREISNTINDPGVRARIWGELIDQKWHRRVKSETSSRTSLNTNTLDPLAELTATNTLRHNVPSKETQKHYIIFIPDVPGLWGLLTRQTCQLPPGWWRFAAGPQGAGPPQELPRWTCWHEVRIFVASPCSCPPPPCLKGTITEDRTVVNVTCWDGSY